MASKEHKELAEFIKNAHTELRNNAVILGAEEAWEKHCAKHELLEEYAKKMEQLATSYWDKNFIEKQLTSRISWSVDFCREYFGNKQLIIKFRDREIEIANKIGMNIDNSLFLNTVRLNLLDVGSCYNPFESCQLFDVLAMDISPANNKVFNGDILNINIGINNIIVENKIKSLKKLSYDVITFCFLLEYIPTSDMRIKACNNAYQLLKYEGILIICTPDSKHVGANAKIMKNWRYTLSKIGYNRIKYEKFSHMHAMVFRKCLDISVASRWAELNSGLQYEMSIPQDFNTINEDNVSIHNFELENICEDFLILPNENVFD